MVEDKDVLNVTVILSENSASKLGNGYGLICKPTQTFTRVVWAKLYSDILYKILEYDKL